MPRTAAFWELRRQVALHRVQDTDDHITQIRQRLQKWQRALQRLRFGVLPEKSWKSLGARNPDDAKELLRILLRAERDLLTLYRHRKQKYAKRSIYCHLMIKRCREKTLWDKVRQKPAF